MGFVGNGKEISETLDRCEENFENTLFQFTYVDAIQELIDQRLVYEFVDKTHNSIYLIKHWFLHNKKQEFLTTNYLALLDKVEVVKGEYQLKNHKPYWEAFSSVLYLPAFGVLRHLRRL